ncbi:MAG: hypothetical protein E7176_05410 [Erysipelotrichaceae bacterium]|nr:hypothetical protein [Erysipelotrichaceae bacterium]
MLKVFLILLAVALVFGVITAIVLNALKKNSILTMYNDIEGLFEDIINSNPNLNCKFDRFNTTDYDYIFSTPAYDYYIKIVPNMSNQEICVNNAVKWQLRKSFNDQTLRFVEGIDGLMKMEMDETKAYKKLFIVYPNARSLLKYINECEMVFVSPTTDVYGTNIIPYLAIKENPNLIVLEKEI